MKILLTGSTGMVGKNILHNSLRTKYEFVCPSRNELDLRNYQYVLKYFNKIKPDMVIHAAGTVGGIKANISHPVSFLVDNMQMGVNVILAAYNHQIKKLINLGSSCMYPKDGQNPLTEDSILTGQLEPTNEGYALAKIVAQRLCNYIFKENNKFNYKTIIPCNLYGKYDDFNPETSHLIPAIIRKTDEAIENKSDIEIWGDGKAKREFMYAGDLSDALFFAIENYEIMDAIMNIGLGYDYTINEYYKKVAELMQYSGKFIYDLEMPSGMKQKLVSIQKQKKIGWNPSYSLEEGLEMTIKYYYKYIK
jgi:GDP-L-fucose synthase